LGAKTLDETISLFIAQQRRQKLSEVFGIDKGEIKPFMEKDRGKNTNSGCGC